MILIIILAILLFGLPMVVIVLIAFMEMILRLFGKSFDTSFNEDEKKDS